MLIRFFLIALICSTNVAASTESDQVRQLIDLAIENSPDLKVAKESYDEASLRKDIAHFDLFPTLALSANTDISSFYSNVSSTNWGNGLSLALSQPIFRPGRNWVNEEQAGIIKEQLWIAYEKVRDKLCLDVMEAYYDYLFATQSLKVQQEKDALLTRQFQTNRAVFEEGRKTYRDVARLDAQLQQAQIDTKTSEQNQSLRQIELARRMGISDVSRLKSMKLEVEFSEPIDESAAQEIDPEQSFDFRIAALAKKANQFDVTLARQAFLPNINFTANGSGSYYKALPFSQVGQGSLSLVLSLSLGYELFDFGQRDRRVKLASHDVARRNSELDATILSLNAEIANFKVNWRTQLLALRLSKKLDKIQESNLQAIQDDYRQGKVRYLDLKDGLDAAISARTNYMSSIFELQKLVARRLYLQGKLYENYH